MHKTVITPKLIDNIICIAKADSGYFWRTQDAKALRNIHQETGPPIKLPNSTTINDNKVGYLPFTDILSAKARKARILADLKSSSLISLGQLADDGCQTTIDRDKLIVTKNNNVVLTGTRNCVDNLYAIPIYHHHPNPKSSISEDNFIMPTIHGIQRKIASLPQTPFKHYHRARIKFIRKNVFNINNISDKHLNKMLLQSHIEHKQTQSLNVILHK